MHLYYIFNYKQFLTYNYIYLLLYLYDDGSYFKQLYDFLLLLYNISKDF